MKIKKMAEVFFIPKGTERAAINFADHYEKHVESTEDGGLQLKG